MWDVHVHVGCACGMHACGTCMWDVHVGCACRSALGLGLGLGLGSGVRWRRCEVE